MCGIIGAVAERNIKDIVLNGLKCLEYRGYDSAGAAFSVSDLQIECLRVQGQVNALIQLFKENKLTAYTGIGHTRWATHGPPSETNAHPHRSGDFFVVHNGIIENYLSLRARLQTQGYRFYSETDTEVIAHLLHAHHQKTKNFLEAVHSILPHLQGAFALAILYRLEPHHIIAVRQGSPLIIGLGRQENFIASDILALAPFTNQFIYLENGDVASLTPSTVHLYQKGEPVARSIDQVKLKKEDSDRGEYPHFMLKEIFEQPQSIQRMLTKYLVANKISDESFGLNAKSCFNQVKRIQIVGCGTSYHAGLAARYELERFADLPCQIEIASEFRYRSFSAQPDTLFITLSQSGETADTLAALRYAKTKDYAGYLSICNMEHSTLVRESDFVLLTEAGPEIGVASTKAFTAQLLALFFLNVVLYSEKHSDRAIEPLIQNLINLPHWIHETLKLKPKIEAIAYGFLHSAHALFIARGIYYPIALEGALKLKETAYIHAEACAAGELKHGPLALVDAKIPVIVLAPHDNLLEKLKSNLQEVKARDGKLFIFADPESEIDPALQAKVILLPSAPLLLKPFLYTIVLQLLAYTVGSLKGIDVDKPRNLAKSVTVE